MDVQSSVPGPKRIWYFFWHILKLVLFRRFRNPLMLAMLAILFAIMSGFLFEELGAPFLFWHDNVVARALGLIGVGIFLEEWVYVAFLLDTDDNNPGKRLKTAHPSETAAEDVDADFEDVLPSTKYVQEAIDLFQESNVESEATEQDRTDEEDKEDEADEADKADETDEATETDAHAATESQDPAHVSPATARRVFDYTRNLHTYATFFLCFVVSISTYTIFSWNDLTTTFYYWKHLLMLLSAIYFPFAGAFMVFLVRKFFNRLLEYQNNKLAALLKIPGIGHFYRLAIGESNVLDIAGIGYLFRWMARLTTPHKMDFDQSGTVIENKFKKFHQIALGKNAVFGLVLIGFCFWFWWVDPKSALIPALILFAICFVALLYYLFLLTRDKHFVHLKSWQWWFALIHLVALPILLIFNFSNAVSSVALIASVLLTLLVGANGWIVFQSRRLWFEFVVIILLILGTVSFINYGRIPQQVDLFEAAAESDLELAGSSGAQRFTGTLESEENILKLNDALAAVARSTADDSKTRNSWKKQFEDANAPGSNSAAKPILVVIANSGGGIKAQVWSTAVITALENVINKEISTSGNSTDAFHRHVRLVTGTSGGMVGATYWVATLTEPPVAPIGGDPVQRKWHHRDWNRARGEFEPLQSEDMIFAMSKDALDDVARQFFYNDLLAFPYNLFAGESRLDARGKALEAALENHGPAFGKSVRSLAPGEDAGWRPTLAFAPAIADDGRRFLICNQDIEYTLRGKLPMFSNPARDSVAGYSWKISFKNSSLKLSQAARLNANFPLFVDSPKIPFEPPLRVMDAGYIDNYGLVIASQWLDHNRVWLKQNTSKVLLVQISATQLQRDESLVSETMKIAEFGGFINSSFNKTLHHTDKVISRFVEEYQQGDANQRRFRMVSFEYEGDASLTWYLSNKEKFSLIYPFLPASLIEDLGGQPDSTQVDPLTISESKDLYRQVIRKEGRRFVEKINEVQAKDQLEPHETSFRNLARSREHIRQTLEEIRLWWRE